MADEKKLELEDFLTKAMDLQAEDLYLMAGEPAAYRVKGKIERDGDSPLSSGEITALAQATVGKDVLESIGTGKGELVTSCSIPGVIDGRMVIAKSMGNLTISIQILPGSLPEFKKLRIPDSVTNRLLEKNGLVIFAGLSGSGKTTTLYAACEYISANRACHICTVEDPIHYKIKPKKAIVQQKEIGSDVLDLESGIISVLRQDADVIMVTEIRNADHLHELMEAVKSGHLVLMQVNGGSFDSVIQWLVDLYPSDSASTVRRQLADTLGLLCVQHLMPKKSGRGRIPAYGVLIPDDSVRANIANGNSVNKFNGSTPEGSQEIGSDIDALLAEGLITEEAGVQARASYA